MNPSFYRQKAGRLISDVLENKLCVRDALAKFPVGTDDISVQTAWHALCHLEADEDLRAADNEYAQTQNEYLIFLKEELLKGEEIPLNIAHSYDDFHDKALIVDEKGFHGFLKAFERFVNVFKP